MSRGRKSGFTLLEALVSAVLMAVGIAAILRGIGSVSRAQALLIDREKIQTLAVEKYEELVATGDYRNSPSGSFEDEAEQMYAWESTLEATGTANLHQLTVTVSYDSRGVALEEEVSGFVYQAPPPTEDTGDDGGDGGDGQ